MIKRPRDHYEVILNATAIKINTSDVTPEEVRSQPAAGNGVAATSESIGW